MRNDNSKLAKNKRKQERVRLNIKRHTTLPRLSVFRSNEGMYAQVIDDMKQETVVAIGMHEVKTKGTKQEVAKEAGKMLAEKALKAKIKAVVFDKGRFAYHGRVKAFADGAREGGLTF